MKSFRSAQRLLPLVLLMLTFAGCSDPESPEERVRAFVAEVAGSAQNRSWAAFRNYVSEEYVDDRGLNKDGVVAVITRYILANQRIFVLKRVASVRINGPAAASAVVYAAIAGQPIERVEDLVRITADVYRFEIDLTENEDGDLEVTHGDWRVVPASEFLVGN